MAIRHRRGKDADFDASKLQSGEIAVCEDAGKVYAKAGNKAIELTGSEHTHEITDIDGLQNELDSKAKAKHTHKASEIDGLPSGGSSSVVVDDENEITSDTLLYIDPTAEPDRLPKRFYGTVVTGAGSGISASVSGAAPSDEYLNASTGYLYVMNSGGTWDYKMQFADRGICVQESDTEPTDVNVKMWIKKSGNSVNTVEADNFNQLRVVCSDLYGKNFLMAGDSYVYGNTLDTSYTWAYLLARKYNCTYAMHGVNGRGLVYSTSAKPSLVAEYASWEDNMDYIGIVGGRNDYNNNYPIGANTDTTDSTFKGGLNVLCNGLQKKYLGKKIFFMTPWCYSSSENSAGAVQKDYADAIEEICALHSIPCFNSYKEAGVNMDISEFRTKYCQGTGDVSHFNADGHKWFLPRIEKWILTL